MNKLFTIATGLVATGLFILSSCSDAKKKEPGTGKDVISKPRTSTDTLPDTPQFIVSFDNKEYSVDAEKVNAYIGSDSVITIIAETGDTTALHLAIPLKMVLPFSVPT